MQCRECNGRLLITEEAKGTCNWCSGPLESAHDKASRITGSLTVPSQQVTDIQEKVTDKPVEVTDKETKQQRYKRKNADKIREADRVAKARQRA